MEAYYDNSIFAENLRRLLKEHDKKAIDLVKYLGVSKAVVSEWMNGKKLPRMDKVDKMCIFFNCKRSDLIDKKREPSTAIDDPQKDVINKLINRLTPEQKNKMIDFLLTEIAGKE